MTRLNSLSDIDAILHALRLLDLVTGDDLDAVGSRLDCARTLGTSDMHFRESIYGRLKERLIRAVHENMRNEILALPGSPHMAATKPDDTAVALTRLVDRVEMLLTNGLPPKRFRVKLRAAYADVVHMPIEAHTVTDASAMVQTAHPNHRVELIELGSRDDCLRCHTLDGFRNLSTGDLRDYCHSCGQESDVRYGLEFVVKPEKTREQMGLADKIELYKKLKKERP